ncbi:cytochrome c oxidase assembly protein CtaG/Cox11-domain-containing protein [Chlamydoabsidia padenii]|nr:cytochrome c oxidase assembly protein CtaG/Cox11-domain-containing protein [Chlamydoabsidia padenii]
MLACRSITSLLRPTLKPYIPLTTRIVARPSLQRPSGIRWQSSSSTPPPKPSTSNASAGMYTAAVFITMLGISYAAVPLYRLFCASTGYSGTVQTDRSKFTPDRLVPSSPRRIRITFESNTSDALPWTFKPELRDIYVVPGETALTFYKAKSQAKEDVVGIATYNVTPYRAGNYFNKIQCFCFEEQRLAPGEDVDMPVFFFIDPDFLDDPYMKDVSTITLGYTLFNAKHAPHLAPVSPIG